MNKKELIWIKQSKNKYECPICHKIVDKIDENTYCPNCGFVENLNHKLHGAATRMINREKPSDRYLYGFEVGKFFGYAGLSQLHSTYRG